MSIEIRKIVREEVGNVLKGEKYSASEAVNHAYRQVNNFLSKHGNKEGKQLYRYDGYLVSVEDMSMGGDEKEFWVRFLPHDAYDTRQKVNPFATIEFSPLRWPEVAVEIKRPQRMSPKSVSKEYEGPSDIINFVTGELDYYRTKKEESVRDVVREELRKVLMNEQSKKKTHGKRR